MTDDARAMLSEALTKWNVNPQSIRKVEDGILYADRTDTMKYNDVDVTYGLYYSEDESVVLSLAKGTGLHAYGGMDYELYAFKGDLEDICCHPTMQEAEDCAIGAIKTGKWCS